MLEYDNSAFYYFAITLTVIYIIPGTWYAVAEFLHAFIGSGDAGTKARTTAEKEKAAQLKKATTGLTRLNNTYYIVNLVLLVIAWAIFLYLIALVVNDGEVSTFDPYVILGIEQGAEMSIIKKAYRRLSLKFHPDKNIGDPNAEEMFMRIAKAYEALTDETARENYEKFGNPDGKQALEVSIGLPKIILENPKVVLVLYLIAMVVVIPSVVGLWYANSKQFGEKNIMYDTYSAFYQLLQEQHRVKNLPEIIAASAESRAINTPKATDNEPMGLLYGKMKIDRLMMKPKFENPTVLRGNLLLHAHVLRLTSSLNETLSSDLKKLVTRTPELLEGLIEIAYQRKWIEVSVSAIKMCQCVVQALWVNSHSLEQLPHLTDTEIKAITKSGNKPQAKSLGEYLRVPDEDKKGLSTLGDEEKTDVLHVCKIIPNLKLETDLFVEEEEEVDTMGDDEPTEEGALLAAEDEKARKKDILDAEGNVVGDEVRGDQIYEQDLVTLRLTFTRENLTEGEKAPPVHAPHFPATLREGWWIVLTDKPNKDAKRASDVNIHAFEKVHDQSRKFTHELRFMAPQRAGTYEMELQVFSDCYMGLDQVRTIQFKVLPAAQLPEYKMHPEDQQLDDEPTLFEQVMAGGVDEESSDEEDDDDEDEDEKPPVNPAAAGKTSTAAATASKSSRVVVVEDDDSEEEDD